MGFTGVEQTSRKLEMKRALAASFVLAALVTAQGAAAADLSLAPLYKAPPAPVALPYDWSGFYLGINGGGGWGRSNWSANNTGFGVNGGQVGGTFGYNRQFGNVVFGNLSAPQVWKRCVE